MIRDFELAHALLDVCVAFILVSFAWETTQHASFRANAQLRWSAIRRVSYAIMGVSFFARGMAVVEPAWQTQVVDLLSGLGITLPMIFFLWLRNMGVVDQDRWIGFRRRQKMTKRKVDF